MKLKAGDRVRAKVRTMSGWKGVGTVTHAAGDVVDIIKDDTGGRRATFCRWQVSKIRNGEAA